MSTSAPSSANYHTALSLISCINTYDFDAARAFLSPSFVYRGQPNNKEEMGINQVQVVIEGLLKARVPRIGIELVNPLLVVEGKNGEIVLHLKSHGAILGSPTDERYEMSYLMIFQFDGEGGKIVSLDEFLDTAYVQAFFEGK